MISDEIRLDTVGFELAIDEVLGTARLQVTPTDGTSDLFVGIAPSVDIARYLSGVAHSALSGMGRSSGAGQMGSAMMTERPGGPPTRNSAPPVPPWQPTPVGSTEVYDTLIATAGPRR